ncbi:FAD-dependent 5-carboxymethylaminomethyl-2-thiouridine(34) oxidoreductase MnmC [Psychrobacter sp. I-STPA10]|uniref:FAD-dependent 5-carboxymethylaminomethyl-2-thiouridine(34) oxidoreductase MnmC n=1 Tax=Psychrobacter sp. I-STPA10 TaxID=2585769 RepID=UPI001E59BE4C|nr:FAD-dependent 5-carboxymethylaminomethyl-2-thiouridine(34) oxidoreductase MnmC [Psychrobacter sp. I-STPA10]
MSESSSIITPAKLDWRYDELGNEVPFSNDFGDVYYSIVDGLAESRYVFVQQNQLAKRFSQLSQLTGQQTFTIAELGFGTGLNFLVTWQLWRQIHTSADTQSQSSPRLHFISTEKYPLTRADLQRALACWQKQDPTLVPLIEQLINQYPTLVAGCHRLHLEADVIVDLWLGDANESLAKLDNSHGASVDAWFLDGFAPACNESLWAQQIFTQMQRLSKATTTAATFSCAGVVKRGLKEAGFAIKKVKGFGRKREMLTAIYTQPDMLCNDTPIENSSIANSANSANSNTSIAIIGAGISGLMTAWSLAQRGMAVTIFDKTAPLAGASGNPRALLAPKMTPIHHVAEHLHSIGYLYSGRLYRQFDHETPYPILIATAAVDLLHKANVNIEQIADYPDEMATTLEEAQAKQLTGLCQQPLKNNLYLPQAGLVNPYALAQFILAHPLINFQQRHIMAIHQLADNSIQLCLQDSDLKDTDLKVAINPDLSQETDNKNNKISIDKVIIAAAYASHLLDTRIFDCRKIRGQLSWFMPTTEQLNKLSKLPLKYGGYCALFTPQQGDDKLNPVVVDKPQFLLGASFVRNDTDTDIRHNEHQTNYDKLIAAIPELSDVDSDMAISAWQARVGIRAQTPDYHPIVGQLDDAGHIWTICAMGSKGFAFAPICAEALADNMTGQFPPLSTQMLNQISPQRQRLQTPL